MPAADAMERCLIRLGIALGVALGLVYVVLAVDALWN